MSIFKDGYDRFMAMDEDDKVATVVGAVFALFVLFLVALLVVFIIDELFVPILIGAAVYSAGIKFFNWPMPKFVKKLFK